MNDLDGTLLSVRRASSTSFASCRHTLTQANDSILSSCAYGSFLYAGTQKGNIFVWTLSTFDLLQSTIAHRGHILALTIIKDQNDGKLKLLSAGSDRCIRIWELHKTMMTLEKCIDLVVCGPDCGDVYAIAYSSKYHAFYVGSQNASIQVT